MKKLFLGVAMLFTCLLSQAQTEFTTYSSCDTNTNGEVNVEDVTNTTNKVLQKTATETNVVTAEQLNTILSEINAKLDKLERLETWAKSISAKVGAQTPEEYEESIKYNGHGYVDLGLSVKWATCNVGATNPEDYGDYFAWGETTGYNGGKTNFNWSNYTLCNGSSSTMTKYCTSSSYGIVDNLTTLESSDDAASVNWGGSWRMPTDAELTELRTSCYWEWTSSYNSTDIAGYIVYKVKSDSDKGVKKYSGSSTATTETYTTSDTHIFLPAAGFRYDTNLGSAGSFASSLSTSSGKYAYVLYFYSLNVSRSDYYRYYGQSVRPVCQ